MALRAAGLRSVSNLIREGGGGEVRIGGELREGSIRSVERRPVVLGGLRGDRVLLIAGLDPGKRVVSLGNELLTFGDPVTIVGEGR